MTTLIVVDDQPLMRHALVSFFASVDEYEVVAEAVDGLEAIEQVRRHAPDVVLMDLKMPRMNGVEATRIITRDTDTKVLALTTFTTLDHVMSCLRVGASGFLVKDSQPADILQALDLVTGDEDALALSNDVVRLVADHLLGSAPLTGTITPGAEQQLTETETTTLQHLACGLNNHEIAEAMSVSPGSVKAYVGRICHKLQVRDRLQAVIRGYELGLVDPSLSHRR